MNSREWVRDASGECILLNGMSAARARTEPNQVTSCIADQPEAIQKRGCGMLAGRLSTSLGVFGVCLGPKLMLFMRKD